VDEADISSVEGHNLSVPGILYRNFKWFRVRGAGQFKISYRLKPFFACEPPNTMGRSSGYVCGADIVCLAGKFQTVFLNHFKGDIGEEPMEFFSVLAGRDMPLECRKRTLRTLCPHKPFYLFKELVRGEYVLGTFHFLSKFFQDLLEEFIEAGVIECAAEYAHREAIFNCGFKACHSVPVFCNLRSGAVFSQVHRGALKTFLVGAIGPKVQEPFRRDSIVSAKGNISVVRKKTFVKFFFNS